MGKKAAKMKEKWEERLKRWKEEIESREAVFDIFDIIRRKMTRNDVKIVVEQLQLLLEETKDLEGEVE